MSQITTSLLPPGAGPQDDILALEKAFSLRNWHYIDIARQERLAGILNRWPLLAEFTTASDSEIKDN